MYKWVGFDFKPSIYTGGKSLPYPDSTQSHGKFNWKLVINHQKMVTWPTYVNINHLCHRGNQVKIPGGSKISKGRFLGAVSPGALGAPENVGVFFCHGNVGNWQKNENHTIGGFFFFFFKDP